MPADDVGKTTDDGPPTARPGKKSILLYLFPSFFLLFSNYFFYIYYLDFFWGEGVEKFKTRKNAMIGQLHLST